MLHVVPHLALVLIRLLAWSWRFHETRSHLLQGGLAGERPLVGAFFHGRLFMVLHFMSRPQRGRWMAMCSQSLDGEAMTKVEKALGYEVVRGSSNSGGFEALVAMIRRVRKDPNLGSCLAVDGSTGPRGIAQPGAISLAQRTGGSILPVAASAKPSLVLRKSWDRTAIPLPFARVHVVYGELIEVPPRLRPEETEAFRKRLEQSLRALQQEADSLSGFSDPEALGPAVGDNGSIG
ncbi:MAG: lysophospholipid acyltransferase family protein [Deltaproteobacteria bacterium]|nr:lysophospholipid acyltransferase family protein [Deltaproteobacteria bacterium]